MPPKYGKRHHGQHWGNDGESWNKAARVDDQAGMDAEAPGIEEKETDAPADQRERLSEEIQMDPNDSTLNVLAAAGGRVLMTLSDAGMQYLLAAARANVGIRAGRYLYEVRIMEVSNPPETGGRRNTVAPKQHVRLGLSLANSSIFPGETEDSVCFDSDGFFVADRTRKYVAQRFARGQVMGLLVNLDASSPNAFTVSLFRDGQRISEPQPLPEHLRGKPLFPHLAFRNVSVHVHWGPQPVCPLPFKCCSLQAAAREDVVVQQLPEPAGGKYSVVFPVGVPDEGTFDWLDTFLEKHPGFVELSDRKIVEWAERSGLPTHKVNHQRTSNDRPDVSFGIPALDDLSARKVIRTVASLVPRNYVVMEVKSNLVKDERQELLRRFGAPHYKRVARVVMGEPSEDYKSRVHATLLAAKQERLEVEWKAKQQERERRRQVEKRQKELAEQRKAAEAIRKKAAEEAAAAKAAAAEAAKKAAEEAAKKAAEEAAKKAAEEAAAAKAAEAAKEASDANAAGEAGGDGTEAKEKPADAQAEAKDGEATADKQAEEAKAAKEGEEVKEEAKDAKDAKEGQEGSEAQEPKNEGEKQEPKPGAGEEPTREETAQDEKKDMEVDSTEAKAEAGDVAKDEAKADPEEEKEEKEEKEEEEEKEPPKAELTEEEAKTWFKTQPASDLASYALATSFASFTVPEAEEGFDEVHFEWQDAAGSQAYLRKWVLERKLTIRIEDIEPSDWFTAHYEKWQKALQDWQMKQQEFRQDPSRSEAAKLKARKEKKEKARKEKAQQEGETKAPEEATPAADVPMEGEAPAEAEAKADTSEKGAGAADVKAADAPEGEPAAEPAPMEDKEDEDDDGDVELPAIDIFTVKDVSDIGAGEPLFANFMFEDWTLMSLRFELFLLVRAFKRDLNDPDRTGIPEGHLAHYYFKYFKKPLNTRFFGMATVTDLVNMVKDTVTISEPNSLIVPQLSEDTDPVSDIFVKLTEESRRDRQRRIDAGDETAKLKFSVLSAPVPPQAEPKAKGHVVAAPRGGYQQWGNQPRPNWNRNYGGQSAFRPAGWKGQSYAPKSQGWR